MRRMSFAYGREESLPLEVIAKPQEISHAKFAKYAKFGSHGYFANVADFA